MPPAARDATPDWGHASPLDDVSGRVAIADLVNRCAHQVTGLPPAVMLVREVGPGAPERRFPIASAP